MILLIASGVLTLLGFGALYSHIRFSKKISAVDLPNKGGNPRRVKELKTELDRIDQLKRNLKDVQKNVEALEIPTPESLGSYDTTKSSLDKISRFYEKYNLRVAGTEQFILSVLPISQVGESLHSLAEVLPHDLGHAVFGDALSSLKEGFHPDSAGVFLTRFSEGLGHIGPHAMSSMVKAVEHGNYLSMVTTPLKAGAMEAFGMNDAIHHTVGSLKDIGAEMANAAEHCTSVGDLTGSADFDMTGHIPIVTLAFSSFREFKLLSNDKTNFISSVKNIVLDAAGAGIGGAAGAKAGALAGCAFGPVGAVIGGVLGGVGGAVGGRFLTNKVKMRPLNKAIEAYETNYHKMQSETEAMSKDTLRSINVVANQKRAEFRGNSLLTSIPVEDASRRDCAKSIAAVLLQFIQNEISNMREGVQGIKKSIWYSSSKHGELIATYETQINQLERQMPTVDRVRNYPIDALETIMQLQMPNRQVNMVFQTKIDECMNGLKEMNDKNDSSILIWSYMLNNLYQKTLNDIAEYSNQKMVALNGLFERWKNTMTSLEADVIREKNKLGL